MSGKRESYYGYYSTVYGTIKDAMTIAETIGKLEKERASTRFTVLVQICTAYFGRPRVKGSHHIFKMPWLGDPRLNLQKDKSKAKPYQVEQVINALKKLQRMDEK